MLYQLFIFRWYYDESILERYKKVFGFPSTLHMDFYTPTMQFVVNVTNQKVICHDNNQLLAFGTRMLPPPEGLLTRLSMIVALVFGRFMLTYGMWQWGHTGAAGRTILMMITKKTRWAAKRSTVCQDLSLCKRQEWYKSFHKKHLSFTKPCWLAMKSLTDAHHLVREQETVYMLIIMVFFSLSIFRQCYMDWAYCQKSCGSSYRKHLCVYKLHDKVQMHLKVGLLIWHYGLKMQFSSMWSLQWMGP